MSGEPPNPHYPLGHVDAAITNWLQSAVPDAARTLLDVASMLGGTPAWLLLIGLSFWWSGSRLGVRVALAVSASGVLNGLLKWLLVQPRPYFVSDRITPLEASDGFGMPSGHAQGAATAWGAVAWWSRAPARSWLWALGAVATFLAGVARVYYGVHSVLQVVMGWAVGAAVVAAVALLWSPVARWWQNAGPLARVAMVVLPTVAALAAAFLLRQLLEQGFQAPVEWAARHQTASLRLGGADTDDLRLLDAGPLLRWSGGLFGASLVAAWYGADERRHHAPASASERAIATAIGALAATALLSGGEALVRRWGGAADFARFAVLLWTLGVVVPRLSFRLQATGRVRDVRR